MANVTATFEATKQLCGSVFPSLQGLTLRSLPNIAYNYLKANSGLKAVEMVAIPLLVSPTLVVGPLLGTLGFGALGPLGGSLAAAFQSANGATTAFSFLQSAAMGGYGAAPVAAAIQAFAGTAGVGAAVAEFRKWQAAQNGTHT